MNKFKKLQAKIFADVMCEALEMKRSERIALGAGSGAVIMAAMAIPALADGDRFDVAIGKMLQTVYGYILGISTGLAIVLIAWNLIKYMAATDPQTSLMAKKAAIRVGIAWLVLNSLGGIAVLGQKLATNGDYKGDWYKK